MAKRHRVEFWQGHLAAWHQSELTQRAYCAQHGLGERAFYRWHRKEKVAIATGKATLTLVSISVGPSPTGSVIRPHSPGGWRIELPAGEIPWLADLLRQLP